MSKYILKKGFLFCCYLEVALNKAIKLKIKKIIKVIVNGEKFDITIRFIIPIYL